MTALGGVLGHRCPVCAHPSHDHRDHGRDVRRCYWPRCACRTTADALVASPTEIYPLYVGGGLNINGAGRRLDRVVPPGDELGGYRVVRLRPLPRLVRGLPHHHRKEHRMTALKIDGKPTSSARAGIEGYIPALYASPGKRVVGVIELEHVERTEPAPGADREPSVKVRMSALEIANPEQEDQVRAALRALYLHRTAAGKLTEDGEVELSEQTLERCAGLLHAIEAARLRAVVGHFRTYIASALRVENPSVTELQHELATVGDGLAAALRATERLEG